MATASEFPSYHSSASVASEAAVDTLAAGVIILAAAAVSSTGTAGSLLVGGQYWNHSEYFDLDFPITGFGNVTLEKSDGLPGLSADTFPELIRP